MPPRKRFRTATSASSSDASKIVLAGGHPQSPRTVDKFRNRKLCDVQLKAADGTTFHAHAVCLTAGSDYFEALYAGSDWADASGSLTLSEVPSDALAACLEFIYAGETTVGSEAQLVTVLEAAAYLQIPELSQLAAEALAKRLGPSTALHAWHLADRQNLATLAEAAAKSAACHFAAVVASEAWLSAPAACVRSLLASNKLVVSNEAQVYDAAVKWLRARSPPLGAEEAAALLSLVRFPLLSYEFYTQTVRKEPLLNTLSGAKMVMDALAQNSLGASAVRRRLGSEGLWVVGGYHHLTSTDVLSIVEHYDPATNSWEAVAKMGMKRKNHGLGLLDGKMYALGGHDGKDFLETVERYDAATNAWEAVAAMRGMRACMGVGALGGKLYAVGGWAGYALDTLERYNSATNTWEEVAAMSTPRDNVAAAVLSGRLYAIGGRDDDNGALNSVERYDPAFNTWEAVAPMSTPREDHAAVVLNGLLYAIGGSNEVGEGDSLDSVERYDPATNTWEAVAPMSTKRLLLGAAAVDGKLYVSGGNDAYDAMGSNLNSVGRYDPATNTWEAVAPMSSERCQLACVAM